MSSFGVTSTGFVKKTLEDIKLEIEASLRAALGDGINLLSTSVFGQIVGIIAERESEIWDLAAAVYGSQYPQSASSQSLDNVAAITGVTRLAAAATTSNIYITGTPTTVVAVGKVVSNDAIVRFAVATEATIAAVAAWVPATPYVVDDLVTNLGNVYICTVAGTSAGAGGPSGTGDGIVDNTAEWDFLGAGTGAFLAAFAAEDTGPLANATDAVHTGVGSGAIETPVAGWDDARNREDGATGRDLETDADFRLRREQRLASTGNATLDALIAKVGEVDGVTESIGFENTTDATDGDGLPPHSFEMIVRGGTDQDIIDAIWATKPAGIESFGSTSGTAVDSIGNSHTVSFSRPTEIPIHIIVELDKNTDYPADGDDQVKAAVKAFGDTFDIGDDVIQSTLYAPIFSISGVEDVTKIWISKIDPPTGPANITIAKDELATFDTDDIDVTST